MTTGLLRGRRWANLRRIRSLDPEADHEEIFAITSRLEFPWDYQQGTGIAFLRDYGVPSIAALLDHTREFADHGVKRYDDTLLVGEEATVEGLDSPRGRSALRRLNRIHGHYEIPEHEFHYVLATTIVGPVRWIERYGWRRLDPAELTAIARVTTRFGELMGLKGLPETYEGYLRLLTDYEREHFAPSEAARRLTEATIAIGQATAPVALRPLVPRITGALMDEPLREALMQPAQPAWLTHAVDLSLRARGRLLRWAPPRRTERRHRATTYPHGYTLADLGPASMLAALDDARSTT